MKRDGWRSRHWSGVVPVSEIAVMSDRRRVSSTNLLGDPSLQKEKQRELNHKKKDKQFR